MSDLGQEETRVGKVENLVKRKLRSQLSLSLD